MAALRAIQPKPPVTAPPVAAPVDELGVEAPVRLASASDPAATSPVRRLQARLEFDLAEAGQPKRWPPVATLLLAAVPSVAVWWGLFVGARALLRLIS